MNALKTEYLGEPIWLLPQKGLYLPRRQTLLVADTHFGKAATFRSAGIPVPAGTTATDLSRLSDLLEATGATRLVVLGDFFHAAAGRVAGTMDAIATWIDEHRRLSVMIIRGNHDEQAGDPPNEWQCECLDEFVEPPFVYRHHPAPHEDGYPLCGHMHPSVYISDRHGPGLTAPCFWFTARCAVLPAFGGFTGRAAIQRDVGDRVFAVCADAVLEIPPSKGRLRNRSARSRR